MKSPASSNTAALALTLKWSKSHTMNKTGDVVNAKQLNLMSSCGAHHVHGSGTDRCTPCCHGYSAHAAQYTQTHLGCGSETAEVFIKMIGFNTSKSWSFRNFIFFQNLSWHVTGNNTAFFFAHFICKENIFTARNE